MLVASFKEYVSDPYISTYQLVRVRSLQRVGKEFEAKGTHVLDSPVSGGMTQSRAGRLTVLVGGREEYFHLAESVLQHLAKILMHVGPAGAGAMAKLVNNAVGLSTLTLLSEVLSVGVKARIDHQTLLTVLRNGAYGQGLFLTPYASEHCF